MTLFRALRNVTVMIMCMGSIVKYHATWYRANKVKGVIDRIKFHFQTNNDVILQIMQKYNYLGKQLSTLFASFIYSAGSIMLLWHLSPIILDKIAPLNESRPIKYPADAESFFNKEKHPIPATIAYFFWMTIIEAIFVGAESLTIMICLHVASLFEVTSYYLQTSVSMEVTDSYISRKCTNTKNMSYLIKSVIMHQETIQFCSELAANFQLPHSLQLMGGVFTLSINLFVLSQSVLHSSNVGENVVYLLLVIAALQYMFLINLTIQYVLDGAANISITIYNTSWYETSIATQKLLQMVILRSNNGFTFTLYNMLNTSLRGFSLLFQTSLSYFTVLLSL